MRGDRGVDALLDLANGSERFYFICTVAFIIFLDSYPLIVSAGVSDW